MGDRKKYKKVHPKTRRPDGKSLHKGPGPVPETVQELRAVLEKWSAEWKEWANWVSDDIRELEKKCGVNLAPPPPPPDPW